MYIYFFLSTVKTNKILGLPNTVCVLCFYYKLTEILCFNCISDCSSIWMVQFHGVRFTRGELGVCWHFLFSGSGYIVHNCTSSHHLGCSLWCYSQAKKTIELRLQDPKSVFNSDPGSAVSCIEPLFVPCLWNSIGGSLKIAEKDNPCLQPRGHQTALLKPIYKFTKLFDYCKLTWVLFFQYLPQSSNLM